MPLPDSPLRHETATIAFVDVVDSVGLMATSEAVAVRRIRELLGHAAREVVPAFGGQVSERRGDGLVLKFAHSRDAIGCLARLHHLAADEHAAARQTGPAQGPQPPPLQLRAGMHKTTLLADDEAIYGAGVNLAARIAALGQPGDTLMSSEARDELSAPLDGLLEDLGPCWLKHVEHPIRVFRHRAPQATTDAVGQDIERAVSARMKLRPTLVVLPMTRPSSGADDATLHAGLGDVLADQLTRALSASPLLHLISPLSARALRGRDLPPQTLYTVLRADYVLRGQFKLGPAGDETASRVRLQFSLWRRGSDEAVWETELSATPLDLLSTQGDVLGRVVHAVSHCILRVEQRAAQHAQALPNLASHTLYLNAVDLLHRFGVDGFNRAHALLLALSERAPRYAEPLAWLARWHVFRVVQGWSDHRQRDGEQAMAYSQRALDRDPTSSLALTMAGSVHAGVKRDAEAAQQCYAQALQHNPNDSLAWLMSGVAQGFMNAGEPALSASEMALGLAPVDPTRHYYDALAATAALRAGAYERCVALARRAISANATHGTAYRSMAIALAMLNRPEEARQSVRQLLGVEPHFTVKNYLARVPTQDANRDHYAHLLQEAGLPAD